ncbi:hypothetical protein BD408DRAFT_133717 [Parasitella parasitica]|nr:hypothetical protein BD408DRAFT_133717 [Parasitella parasitica]
MKRRPQKIGRDGIVLHFWSMRWSRPSPSHIYAITSHLYIHKYTGTYSMKKRHFRAGMALIISPNVRYFSLLFIFQID